MTQYKLMMLFVVFQDLLLNFLGNFVYMYCTVQYEHFSARSFNNFKSVNKN